MHLIYYYQTHLQHQHQCYILIIIDKNSQKLLISPLSDIFRIINHIASIP